VISFNGMEDAEGEAPTGLVRVKQIEDKPSCAEDSRIVTRKIPGWLPVPSLAVCRKTMRNKRDCSEMRLTSAYGYTGQATYILRTKLSPPTQTAVRKVHGLLSPATSQTRLSDLTERQSVHGHKSTRNTPSRIDLPDLGLPGTARVLRILMHMSPRCDTRQQEARQP
jgi:hypothetical protein